MLILRASFIDFVTHIYRNSCHTFHKALRQRKKRSGFGESVFLQYFSFYRSAVNFSFQEKQKYKKKKNLLNEVLSF